MNRTVTLPIGRPGLVMAGDGTLTIDGHVTGEPRRLSDLLRAGGDRPPYLADRAAAEKVCRAGEDPLLYRAVRHVLPSRSVGGHELFADLVVYEPGTLPGGEPHRSTGHWNTPGQLEIFQTLTGRVEMFVAGTDVQGERFAYRCTCGPGEALAVPFGCWHVSYVVDGPAAVFNIYADGVLGGEPENRADKYARAAPVRLTRRSGGWTGADRDAYGEPQGPPCEDWLSAFLPAGTWLAEMHLDAPESTLLELVEAARTAHFVGWPGRGGFEARPGG